MAVTPQQIAEIEAHFKSITVPDRLKLNVATTMTGVPGQISDKLSALHSGELSERMQDTFYDLLIQIKDAIENNRVL